MLLSPVPFSIGYGDKVTVNMVDIKWIIIPGGMINICLGGVRLEFPRMVKFQKDCCLECGSMIIYYDTENGQLSNLAEL